jgi:hypothetical protein
MAVAPPVTGASAVVLAPPPTAPATREVLLMVAPPDATITRDGKDLGPQPLALHLAEGESAALVIARKGYKTKSVAVDGGTARQTFTLEPLAAAPAKPAGASKPPNAGAGSLGRIDDVGDPFAHQR